MKIVLYSTPICPNCKALRDKMHNKGINFEENQCEQDMRSLGISRVPVLVVDNNMMNFAEANRWINAQ